MAHVVVLGAGLGGTIMAYELRQKLSKVHKVSAISQGGKYHFVPSNPWVGVGWRDRAAIEVDLVSVMKKHNIGLHTQGAKRLHANEKRIELNGGESLAYMTTLLLPQDRSLRLMKSMALVPRKIPNPSAMWIMR